MGLVLARPPEAPVWRVGYAPDPLSWAGWEYATDGRFHGRWDDPEGGFRTLYLGQTLLGCLVEVLAHARTDQHLADALDEIVEEPEDAQHHPTAEPGSLDSQWLQTRRAATAVLRGQYCQVSASETIAELYPRFIGAALEAGYEDFDAALLKDGAARSITQEVAAHLYLQPGVDGVEFESRHGDDLRLWCVFEQPSDDGRRSQHILALEIQELTAQTPELQKAMRMLGLHWQPTP